MRPARSATAVCSSSSWKSIVVPLHPWGPGQAQTEHGDQVPLDLVDPAAEGEDQRTLVGPVEPAGEGAARRLLAQRSTLTEHLHQQSVGPGEELGANTFVDE